MTPEDAPIGYERSLLRGHKSQVVTVEIRVASKGDAHAERTILGLLEWAKEGYPSDFNLDTWQVTSIADDFSDEAKAYNPDWQDDDDPNEGIDGNPIKLLVSRSLAVLAAERDKNCRLYREATCRLAEVATERDALREALLDLYSAAEEAALAEHEHEADVVTVEARLVKARAVAKRVLGV